MFRKSILNGLFVLNNGTKSLQGRYESQLYPHAFFWVVTGDTGNGGVFHTGGYGQQRHWWVNIAVDMYASLFVMMRRLKPLCEVLQL